MSTKSALVALSVAGLLVAGATATLEPVVSTSGFHRAMARPMYRGASFSSPRASLFEQSDDEARAPPARAFDPGHKPAPVHLLEGEEDAEQGRSPFSTRFTKGFHRRDTPIEARGMRILEDELEVEDDGLSIDLRALEANLALKRAQLAAHLEHKRQLIESIGRIGVRTKAPALAPATGIPHGTSSFEDDLEAEQRLLHPARADHPRYRRVVPSNADVAVADEAEADANAEQGFFGSLSNSFSAGFNTIKGIQSRLFGPTAIFDEDQAQDHDQDQEQFAIVRRPVRPVRPIWGRDRPIGFDDEEDEAMALAVDADAGFVSGSLSGYKYDPRDKVVFFEEEEMDELDLELDAEQRSMAMMSVPGFSFVTKPIERRYA